MKCGGLGIPNPWLLEERENNTSKVASKVLLGSLLIGTNLNYIAHKGCVRRSRADGQKQREFSEKEVFTRQRELMDRAGLNCLRWNTYNGVCITAILQCLNGTELSR